MAGAFTFVLEQHISSIRVGFRFHAAFGGSGRARLTLALLHIGIPLA